MKRLLNQLDLDAAAVEVAKRIRDTFKAETNVRKDIYVYPVPRGGIPAFYLVRSFWNSVIGPYLYQLKLAKTPEEADVILDDLVDSGKTADHYRKINPSAKFLALIYKTADGASGYTLGEWLVFPWEQSEEKSIEDSFTRILQYIGEDPTRGGLLETPSRMAKAWKHWTSGYDKDPTALLKTFEDGAEVYDEMVTEINIPFYSQCEHHLAPFFGTVCFGYIPQKKVVGLSKMNRLVDLFARRLQVQERMTSQILDSFCEFIQPLGAAISVRARHMCVESRGIQHTGCETVTTRFFGVIKDKPEARAEFLGLTNRK